LQFFQSVSTRKLHPAHILLIDGSIGVIWTDVSRPSARVEDAVRALVEGRWKTRPMRVEVPEDRADQEQRARWPWLVATCAGLAVGAGGLLLIALWSYVDAGGTLGGSGYGDPAVADLDDAEFASFVARRAWLAAVVAGAVPFGYACWRAWTARTSAERRTALSWAGVVVGCVVVAGATPAIVHALA
jgi:hypothetical protein